MRKAGYRRIPLGLGDVVVITALGILALLAAWPHLESRVVAGRETAVEQRLARLLSKSAELGVLDRFESCMTATASIEGLSPMRDFRGADASLFPALWRSGSHFYVLDLVELLHGGKAVLRACPRSHEEQRSAAGWNDEPAGELGALLEAVKGSGLRDALLQLVTALEPELHARQPDERQPATELPGLLADDYYLYRLDFARATPTSHWHLEAHAWPFIYGSSGFAAFYADAPERVFHTRNIKKRYSGARGSRSGRPPTLAAALARKPDDDRSGIEGYTGVDGNRWFPARR